MPLPKGHHGHAGLFRRSWLNREGKLAWCRQELWLQIEEGFLESLGCPGNPGCKGAVSSSHGEWLGTFLLSQNIPSGSLLGWPLNYSYVPSWSPPSTPDFVSLHFFVCEIKKIQALCLTNHSAQGKAQESRVLFLCSFTSEANAYWGWEQQG